jgi:hypothetical protein
LSHIPRLEECCSPNEVSILRAFSARAAHVKGIQVLKSLMIKAATLAVGVGLAVALGSPEVAQAQTGFVYKEKTNGVRMDGAKRCPSKWREDRAQHDSTEKPGYCYPSYANSPKVMRRTGDSCPSGYGVDGEWCTEGHIEHPQLANPNVMQKANQADRCPAGFYTYMDKCTTELARPPKARVKGKGECNAGEVSEWGIWCTSDFDHLSVQDIRSAHYRDWNYIYSMTSGGTPRQGPDDEDASEVYKAMFGDDRLDGPVGQANSALVNKRPLTPEQRQLLANANAATAAMLPPEESSKLGGGSDSRSASGSGAESGGDQATKSKCDDIKLRGKLGKLARQAAGC